MRVASLPDPCEFQCCYCVLVMGWDAVPWCRCRLLLHLEFAVARLALASVCYKFACIACPCGRTIHLLSNLFTLLVGTPAGGVYWPLPASRTLCSLPHALGVAPLPHLKNAKHGTRWLLLSLGCCLQLLRTCGASLVPLLPQILHVSSRTVGDATRCAVGVLQAPPFVSL